MCLAGFAAAGAAPAGAGEIQGRVVLDVPGVALSEVRPIVVYLEPSDREPPAPKAAGGAATLRQKSARFAPGFLVVAMGQTVEMPNDDDIYHNVFSFSAPNDFDLGLYPASHSRSISFRHPGVVRIYCSIHESMNGVIFVAPTEYFAQVDDDGRFALRDVPRGRWRLRTWAQTLPAIERSVVVGDASVRVELRLAEDS